MPKPSSLPIKQRMTAMRIQKALTQCRQWLNHPLLVKTLLSRAQIRQTTPGSAMTDPPASDQLMPSQPLVVSDLLWIFAGMLIYAVGVNLFLVDARLLSGGLTGIGLILQYRCGIPVGWSILFLNLPLFWLSWRKLSARFTLLSVLGVVCLSGCLLATRQLSGVLSLQDVLMSCLLGGSLQGLGLALVLAHQGSSGGSDICAIYLRRHDRRLAVGTYNFLINSVIILLGLVIIGVSSGLYTIVSLLVMTWVTNSYISRFHRRKALLIITAAPEVMAAAILQLRSGVTFLYGEGAYTHHERKVIFCILPREQLPTVRSIIHRIDSQAFVSIIDAAEVEGRSFPQTI